MNGDLITWDRSDAITVYTKSILYNVWLVLTQIIFSDLPCDLKLPYFILFILIITLYFLV